MRTDVEKLVLAASERETDVQGTAAGGGGGRNRRGDLRTESEGHVRAENMTFVTRSVSVTAEGACAGNVPLGTTRVPGVAA